jgi:hypothetical protein
MNEEIFFINDPSEGKRKGMIRSLEVLFDVEERVKTNFMRNFIFALVLANKK